MSSAWEGPQEFRPIGRVLAVWQSLIPASERPPAIDVAATLLSEGDVDGAMTELSGAMCEDPDDPLLLEARGHLQLELGFERAAEGDFEYAIQIDPERPSAWSALGRACLELELYCRSAQALEKAIDLGLDDAEHHVLLARAYRGSGQRERAGEEYLAAIYSWRGNPTSELLVEVASLASSRPGEILPADVYLLPLGLLEVTLELAPGQAPDPDSLADWRDLANRLAQR